MNKKTVQKKNGSVVTLEPRPTPARKDTRIYFTKPTRTKQSFKDDCDINVIMSRFEKTGQLPPEHQREANYGFASADTFQDAMFITTTAQQMFDELPSAVRKRFGHDTAAFLEFATDDKNKDDLADMGLLSPEATKAVLVARAAKEALDNQPAPKEADKPPAEAKSAE